MRPRRACYIMLNLLEYFICLQQIKYLGFVVFKMKLYVCVCTNTSRQPGILVYYSFFPFLFSIGVSLCNRFETKHMKVT